MAKIENTLPPLLTSGISIHNDLSGLNVGEYIHLTATEKTKFDNLPNSFAPVDAEKNVNTDWNATSGDEQLLNKPTIPSIAGLATESYVDNKVAGLLDLRGNYDASSNAFPSSGGSGTSGAILKGDFWYISVAGTLNGQAVNIGDSIYALNDAPSSSQWEILQANLTYVPENSVNKATTMTGNTTSDTKFLTAKAVYDWVTSLGYWVSVNATNLVPGISKLYNAVGTETDGGVTPNAVKVGLDLKADKSTTPTILKNNFAPNTLTALITTETIVDNYDLGIGFLEVGESLILNAELVKNVAVSGNAQSFFYLSKVSNSIAIGDAVKIATSAILGVGNGSAPVVRTFHRKSTSILSGRVVGTTALLSDALAISNIPQNLINDVNLSDYRYLIVASTYSGTSSPNTIQTNVILTKNPVV
jgi:hypothetical protein